MRIEPLPPFEISPEPDGTKHAIRGDIQISILPDVGEAEMTHRVGKNNQWDVASRWLYINLKEKGLKIYVHGSHVVMSEAELLPTFSDNSVEELLKLAFQRLKVGKDKKGRYIMDTPENRHIVRELLSRGEIGVRSRLLSAAGYGANSVLGGDK